MTTDDASRTPDQGSAAGDRFALPETQRDREWLAWQQEAQRRIMAVFMLPAALLAPLPEGNSVATLPAPMDEGKVNVL